MRNKELAEAKLRLAIDNMNRDVSRIKAQNVSGDVFITTLFVGIILGMILLVVSKLYFQ